MKHTIAISYRAWEKLKGRITEDYGQATVLISWRLKATLGFTVREHRDYTADVWHDIDNIRLDFYDEQLQTLFLLRYSDYLQVETNLQK